MVMPPAASTIRLGVVAFGGPEGMDEVVPFLENTLRGRNIPRERLAEVGKHYELFGGVSPINGQMRALIAALEADPGRVDGRASLGPCVQQLEEERLLVGEPSAATAEKGGAIYAYLVEHVGERLFGNDAKERR